MKNEKRKDCYGNKIECLDKVFYYNPLTFKVEIGVITEILPQERIEIDKKFIINSNLVNSKTPLKKEKIQFNLSKKEKNIILQA